MRRWRHRMSEPIPGFHSPLSPQSSLWQRIRENLQSVRAASRVRLGTPLGAGADPIHLLESGHDNRLTAQAGSTALHVLGFAVLLAVLTHPAINKIASQIPVRKIFPGLRYSAPASEPLSDSIHLGKTGGGGDRNPLPPTNGNLPQYARIRI